MPNPIEPGDRGEPGTAGIEPIVDVAVDDDVFAAEFDKAEEVGDKLDLSAGDDPKNIKKEEEEKEPPKEEAKKEEEPTIPDKPEIESEEKMEQKYKTLQGIHKHDKQTWAEEKTELLGKLEEAQKPKTLEEKPIKKETVTAETFAENLTDEQKAELEAYESDFDTISKMEGLKRGRELAKLRKELQEWKEEVSAKLTDATTQIEPVIKMARDSEVETHFNTIRSGYTLEDGTVVAGHGDYQRFVDDGSLNTWIESKPAYIRTALERVVKQGNAQDVVDLLTDFKRENDISIQGQLDNIVDLESKKAEKKAALAAVGTRRTVVQPTHSFVDDYDGAFDEALKKSGG